ncbi:MAG: tetratricopeptide repeat protein [Pseudomonadota bacterium]
MKNSLIILMCTLCLNLVMPANAQDSAIVVNQEEHSVFTGLFRSVWARLKSLNPTAKQSAQSVQVYTAGIRGSEATDTLLTPYWKDDLTQDEDFQLQLETFSRAQLQMDQGKLDAAITAFDNFLGEFAQSDLRPNALFGKSISLAGLGKNEQSRQVMQQFIDENPNHPLVADAELVIGELN